MSGGWRRTRGAGRTAALLASVAVFLSVSPDTAIVKAGRAQEAGGLARRVADAPEGTVRFGFAAREGVCGDGRGHINLRHDRRDDAERCCEPGPVWVEVTGRGGLATDLDTWVGAPRRSRSPARTDLGLVGAAEATGYLLGIARSGVPDVAEDAVSAAALADSVEIWPDLLSLVRDEGMPRDARQAAVFWLSHLAGERVVGDLEDVVRSDGDLEVRQAALFSLSRLPDGAGFDPIMRIARSSEEPELVQAAMFWLGQSEDPRAIAFFEEILAED